MAWPRHSRSSDATPACRRFEDTGLPFPVRAAANSDAAQAGQATAAGIRALGTCCSALTRLLRLASRRDHAQPAPQLPSSSDAFDAFDAFEACDDAFEACASKYKPVQLDSVMDFVYDSATVLTFWALRPGKPPGALHCAWCQLQLPCSLPRPRGTPSLYQAPAARP